MIRSVALHGLRRAISCVAAGRDKSADELAKRISSVDGQISELQKRIHDRFLNANKSICIFGAGRSAAVALEYFLNNAADQKWKLHVGDMTPDAVRARIGAHPAADLVTVFEANVESSHSEVVEAIEAADIVVSLLPADQHIHVVRECVARGVDVITPSFVSDEIQALDAAARERGSLVLMECGLEPGLDHMTATAHLRRIRAANGEVVSFESFTGGFLPPELTVGNPWAFKFTTGAADAVAAGRGVSKFADHGHIKYVPYQQVFRRIETFELGKEHFPGQFEAYANKDSLKYRSAYGLDACPTLFRGTLRRLGFCSTWDIFVQLGMTESQTVIEGSESLSYRDFVNSFLMWRPEDTVELKLAYHLNISVDSPEFERLRWLGIFDPNKKVGIPRATPARILERILAEKLVVRPEDLEKDSVVVLNRIHYETIEAEPRQLLSTLVVEGDGAGRHALAKAVGASVGLITKHVLRGALAGYKGVHIPTMREIAEPVLDEMQALGLARASVTDRSLRR